MSEKQSGEPEERMGAGDTSQGCCHQIGAEAREWGVWLKGEEHEMKLYQERDSFLVEGRV